MLPSGRAMPSAGRMRPKTMSFGSLATPSTSPVRTMTLRATLVKSPKKAFQSPGTHQRTRNSCSAVASRAMCYSLRVPSSWFLVSGGRGTRNLLEGSGVNTDGFGAGEGGQEGLGGGDPAEDPALGLDHLEGD